MPQLLLIDRHHKLARKLQVSLLFEDIEVVHIWDSKKALSQFSELASSIVVIRESSSNMISLLFKIRAIDHNVPIIMIIQSNHWKDRVRMFRLGANDVMSTPYHSDELIARIINLLHLCAKFDEYESSIEIGELLINTKNRLVFRQDEEIQLTPTEYELLLFLAKDVGKAHTRENILNEVWGYEYHGNTNIVDVYIRYLRIKIDKGHKNKLIKTVRGVGYMLTD